MDGKHSVARNAGDFDKAPDRVANKAEGVDEGEEITMIKPDEKHII
jgi:hypothetical protein